MSSPREIASDFPSALERASRDPWARLTLLLVFLVSLPFLVPESLVPGIRSVRLFSTWWTPTLMLLVLVPSYVTMWRSARDDQERSFWSDISLALLVWLFVWVVIPSIGERADGRLVRELAQLILYSIAYVLQLVAAERQPHRSNAWRPRGLERAVLLPALAIFVVLLGCYFVVVPAMVSPSQIQRDASSFHLYLFFDVLLTLRFTYLSRIAESLRWRLVYLFYGLACLGFLASNAIEWQLYRTVGEPNWAAPWNALWVIPFVLLALPPCFARVPYAPRTTRPRILEPWHGTLAGSSRVTLLWALVLPLAHIALHHFELLDPASRPLRRDLMLLCVVLLGVAALVQQKVLEERSRSLWTERREVEQTLRSSENDLRLMVERNKTAERLAVEDEKFTRAFRIHHDGLAISLLETGEIIDVNPSFEKLTGFSRDEVIGQAGEDIGFWPDGYDRRGVVKALMETGHLRHVEGTLPTRDGRGREVLASFELLYDRERHYMMSVLHDVEAEREAERRLRRSAAFLDEAEAAILTVDEDGRVDYWNPAAARLLDLDESDRRRPLSDLTAGFGNQLWLRTVELGDDGDRARLGAGDIDDSLSGSFPGIGRRPVDRVGTLILAVRSDRLPDHRSRGLSS